MQAIMHIPRIQDILEGKILVIDGDVSLKYAVNQAMIWELASIRNQVGPTEEELMNIKFKGAVPRDDLLDFFVKADRYMAFSMTNFHVDLVLMGLIDCLKHNKLPFSVSQMPNLRKFFRDYEEHLPKLMSM